MGWSALLKADLLALSKSWVLRGWLIALVLAEMVTVGGAIMAARGAPIAGSQVLAGHLNLFLLVWSTVIIVLSAGSVSLESDIVCDSILSRACTRAQYLYSRLATRALVVGGVYLISSAVAAYAAWRYAGADMTLATMSTGIGIVGLAMLLLLSLGILLSVAFNNTLYAVIGLLLLWYVAGSVFSFVGAEYLSPMSLTRNLPSMLRDSRAPEVLQATATASSMTLTFSKPIDPGLAETSSSYTVECPLGTVVEPETATYDRARGAVTLAGMALPAGEEARVTVRGVTDTAGNPVSIAGDTVTAAVPAVGGKPPARTTKPRARRIASSDRVPPHVVSCTAGPTSVKVTFSEPLDSKTAEDPGNYTVESPAGHILAARAATYSVGSRAVLLSGLPLTSGAPIKVTATEVKDAAGNRVARTGNSATYSEVATWKYVVGFGAPTLAFCLLSVVWYSRRDL